MAAIITIQTPRNQPAVPRPVHGPLSIPRIWSAVHNQPMAARAKSRATRPNRARAAENAGASPLRAGTRTCAGTVTRSGGPGEVGLRETGLALVLDAEGVDPRPFRLRHREVRADRVEHAVEPDRLAGLDAEGHDVLDLEVDAVADADAVPHSVVV